MISLPPGFDVALLLNDLFGFAAPFLGIALMVSAAFLFSRILKRVV